MNAPIIYIRPCPFGGSTFDIVVEPKPTYANFDVERDSLKSARRYADSLAIAKSWKVVDQSGEPT